MITVAQMLGQNALHLVPRQDNHALCAAAHKAFVRMQRAAALDGVDIQIASSYRDFARQLLIWNAKWSGQRPLYSLEGELLDSTILSDEQKLHSILTWSALPGASRHHWGTDLDVYDKTSIDASGESLQLNQAEYASGGPCFALACWLDKHAEQFNFKRPYQYYTGGVAAEPWHLSYQPLAAKIEQKQNSKRLKKLISQTDIQGKDSILANLEMIFNRYILNQGNL